jgi:hypothetical protein
MHIEIARNRSTLINPQESEEHKTAARFALEAIAADPSDRRQQDAIFVLRELGLTSDGASTDNGQAVSTENVQDERAYEPNQVSVDALLEDFKTLTAEEVFAKWRVRRRAEYEQCAADGLTNEQTVARIRERHGPNSTTHYSMIAHRADECRKEQSRSSVYRYHLPLVYSLLKETPDYDTPTRDLAEATLAEYLPYKWLTRELFEEMQEALKSDPSKSSFEQIPIATRVAPHIERWKKIKSDWEEVNGPTIECLSDVLYNASIDHVSLTAR